ncbi:hypothetical protein D3C72_1931040 [compost metagenome]
MRHQHHVRRAQHLPGMGEHAGMGVQVVDVQGVLADLRSPAHAQVGADRGQALPVACHQAERRAAGRIAPRDRFGDGGGGADDEDLLHAYSVTRRQKPDEKRGSMNDENACQRG